MTFRRFPFALLVACLLPLAGCKASDRSGASSESATVEPVVDAGCPHMVDGTCSLPTAHDKERSAKGRRTYGAPLGASPTVTLAELLDAPEKYHDQTVLVSGYVRRACSKKGCWMEVSTDRSDGARSCRVTFKDYGFLVPTDSAGAQAKMEAKVQLTEVKREAIEHYEAEGATFPGKRADGTATEVRLVATGVELERT